MQVTDLLPCPFCDNTPIIADMAGWEIMCNCGVNMCLISADKERLLKAWNTRTTPPEETA